MRVVALYRVSTERQGTDGASLDAQERRYRELAAAHGWQTVAEFRGAESATQASSERVMFQRVLATLREQHVDALWVYEQSRLTRGDVLDVAMLERELREREIALFVDGRKIDLRDESDGLVFGVTSLVDRLEVQKFRRRVAAGREEKARKGKRAVGKAPFGYRNPPPGDSLRGTLQIVEDEAAVVRRIFALAADGHGRRAIARLLSADGIDAPRAAAWSKTSIRRILENRSYLGHAVARAWVRTGRSQRLDPANPRAIVYEDAHEAIVTAETWERAHARDGATGGRPFLLTGLLWVAGKRVGVVHSRGSAVQYRPIRDGGAGVSAAEADALVWAGFLGLLRYPDSVARLLACSVDEEGLRRAEAEVIAAEANAARQRARIERLTDMREGGEIDRDTYRSRKDAAGRQLREAEERSLALRRQLAVARDGQAEGWYRAAAMLAAATKMDSGQRRTLLLSLFERFDATLLDRGPQAKGPHGGWLPREKPRWGVDEVWATLRVVEPATTLRRSAPSRVTVKIVAGGVAVAYRPLGSDAAEVAS